MPYLMKCGHVSNGVQRGTGKPVCVICGCYEVDEDASKSALKGRKAKCDYCERIADSNFLLPFFNYRPNYEYDRYYCGCRGWD